MSTAAATTVSILRYDSAAGRRADAARVVHELQVVRVGVGFGVDAERNDPHFARRARDANGDFAAVGDQQTRDHLCETRWAALEKRAQPFLAFGLMR